MALGLSHSCFLHVADGQVRCVGTFLGARHAGDHPLDLGRRTKQLTSGSNHLCAILDDDSLRCWGHNDYGQLGRGDTETIGDAPEEMGNALHPVDLGTSRTAKQMCAGELHTCAVLDDGSVKCFGNGGSGQLGQGTTIDIGNQPNQMGDNLPAVDLGGRKAKQISCGYGHTCAILNDDSLRCWGENYAGQLGRGDTEDVGDGPGEMGDVLHPIDLGTDRTAKHVAAGARHTCVILDDSSVKCFGLGSEAQLGQGRTIISIGSFPDEMGDHLTAVDLGIDRTAKDISCGESFTCVLLDNNAVKCFGANWAGQLGQGHDKSIGDDAFEMNALNPIDLGTSRTAVQVAAGSKHTCALLENDRIVCWGEGWHGQLGGSSATRIGDETSEMGDFLEPVDFGTIIFHEQPQLRLVGGAHALQGCLQVHRDGEWREVCEDDWDAADAQVVCGQLGLGGGLPIFGWMGSGAFWMDDVACMGTEANLGHCSFRGWGIHDCELGEAAGVQCHVDAWSSFGETEIAGKGLQRVMYVQDVVD
eukprot:Skav233182  [mRNA]  locus=scaffold24:196492:198081:+ [translate_table: standard]